MQTVCEYKCGRLTGAVGKCCTSQQLQFYHSMLYSQQLPHLMLLLSRTCECEDAEVGSVVTQQGWHAALPAQQQAATCRRYDTKLAADC
jgi:hypothetical protein